MRLPGRDCFDIVLARHPIDRLRSIYDFLRAEPVDHDEVGALARRSDLRAFCAGLLERFPNYANSPQVTTIANAGGYVRPPDEDDARRAVRAGGEAAGVPLSINARVDSLRRGETFEQAVERANAYLGAGGDSAFVLGLGTAELVARAVAEIDGPVAVIAWHGHLPLTQLAELGVARVSFGPGPQALAMTHLARAAEVLTARGDYPAELAF